jgi:hypothetical protein
MGQKLPFSSEPSPKLVKEYLSSSMSKASDSSSVSALDRYNGVSDTGLKKKVLLEQLQKFQMMSKATNQVLEH